MCFAHIGQVTYLAYIALCLIWGSTFMAIKLGLADAPPLTTAALRFCVALALIFMLARWKRVSLPVGWRARGRLALPGFFIFGLNYAFVYLAEVHITSSLTAILYGSIPFWVALFSLGLLKQERLTMIAWIGIVIGFVGVVVISYDQFTVSGDLFYGSLLTLAACAAASFGTVLHKRLHTEAPVLAAVLLQMTLGWLVLIPLALVFERPSDFVPTAHSIGSVVYLATLGTVAAFLLFYWLIQRLKVITLSMIDFISPLIAVFIGVVLYNEPLSTRVAIGSALVLGGVALVLRREKAPPPTSQFPRQ